MTSKLKIIDNVNKDVRDYWIDNYHCYNRDGNKITAQLSYIPDSHVVNIEFFGEFVEKMLDGDKDFISVQTHLLFSEILEELSPKFMEMTFTISPLPSVIWDLDSTTLDTAKVYFSCGKDDWKDYELLRLSNPKF